MALAEEWIGRVRNGYLQKTSCAINMEVAIRSPIEYQETLACNHLLRKEAN